MLEVWPFDKTAAIESRSRMQCYNYSHFIILFTNYLTELIVNSANIKTNQHNT